DAELARLEELLEISRSGKRQIAFLTGAAGVGKTTMLETFLETSCLHGSAPVRVARGACLEQHGAREPYMPVLEALERLSRESAGNRLTGLLHRVAPTWLAQMPWVVGEEDA